MVAQLIPVPRFQAEHEEPIRVLPLTEVRPAAGRVSVRTRPGGEGALATVPEETTSDLPVRFLLAVEDGGERVSLSLRMHVTQGDPPTPYYLETPGTVRGLRLAMRFSESGQGDLQLETDYTGLDAAKAYSYARFVAALKRREGIFRVLAYAGNILRHVATIQLPLPFDESDRERSHQDLRFWEAVREVGRATGTRLVCPPEITDEDLKSLNFVFGAIRNGWIVEEVSSFTIPPTAETAANLLRAVEEEGGVLKSLAMVTEHETREIFGAEIDLGTCIRHVSPARMLTPPDKIRAWLASNPSEREDLTTLWEPADGAPMAVLFPGWPKAVTEEQGEQDIGKLLFHKGGAPLRLDADGAVRAGGTRVTLDSIAAAWVEGDTAEEIAIRFPVLSRDDLNQILGWYLRYRDPVDAYLARREGEAERFREEMEARFEPIGLRERLLARRGARERDSEAPEGPTN
jgi:uncharacterized protein (DUF433 family)